MCLFCAWLCRVASRMAARSRQDRPMDRRPIMRSMAVPLTSLFLCCTASSTQAAHTSAFVSPLSPRAPRAQPFRLSAAPQSVAETVEAVRSGALSVQEVVRSVLQRIEHTDDAIGAFLSVSGDAAMARARRLDEALARGDKSVRDLPLLGLPVAIKDNLCTAGIPTTAASRVLEGYVPSYDATAVSRLLCAGAIVVGKTNMDEFAMGSTTETSAYLTTKNPRDLTRTPGGSSGGSAAAVASEQVLVALGTDTGGSIRQPASWTGIVGLKPSYGRVSRYGLLAYGSSTDCVGPMGRTVSDVARVTAAIAGPDPLHDATASREPVPDYMAGLERIAREMKQGDGRPLKGIRVGVIRDTLETRIEPAVSSCVKAAVSQLSSLGAEVVEVSIPYLDQHCASYYVNVLSEASANLARYDGTRYGLRRPQSSSAKNVMLDARGMGFGEEVKQRILLGTFSLSAGYADDYYDKSQQLRSILIRDFAKAFERADVFVCPTAPTVAYRLGRFAENKVDSYADDLFTVPASLAGLPAISVPVGNDPDGLPIGLQIIGRRLAEQQILEVAHALELAQA